MCDFRDRSQAGEVNRGMIVIEHKSKKDGEIVGSRVETMILAPR